jgi:hypothetical protein
MRSVLTVLCTLIGGAALVVSVFSEWNDGRLGRNVPMSDLWAGISTSSADLLGSVFVPLALATVLALVGALTRRRLILSLGAVVGLATPGLFWLQQENVDQLTRGWTNAASGAVLLLIAVVLVPKR